VGLDRMPNVSTLSRRLAEFDGRAVDNLRGLLRGLVAERAIAASPKRLTLDFDGSVISTKARGIEGTAVGYNSKAKGSRSYYPLFAVMAQTGQIFDLLHRAGNCHDSRGALDFILACEQNLRDQEFQGVFEVRIDGAHYSDATCSGLHDAGVEFSVSVPFERLPRLKAIVEKRTLWHRIDDEWSYFQWLWRPSAKSRGSFPCVIYRRHVAKPRKGPIQLDLFEPIARDYEYKVAMTNKSLSPASLLRYHNGRGSQEATFAEAKSQLGLSYLPSRREVGNQVYMLCNLIAHALGREIQMRAAPPRSKNTATRACLWTLERIGTLRNRLIKRAARIIHPQGRLVLSFANCPEAESDLRQFIHAASNAA
ncbi:MAG TPA: IS1380 family transposase, partial [Roseibacterium sp.]|nr:IS1380 family transposase [Roseibacterium sp.]